MDTDFVERRQHIRVYFDNREETICQFALDGKAADLLSASVLDLSLGGINLAVMENKGNVSLAVGDRLILNGLTHCTGPVCEVPIPMEIRWNWIFTQAEFSHLYIGCQFLYVPEQNRCSIANLISVKLLESSAARIGLVTK